MAAMAAKPVIHVVDDDQDIRELLVKLLASVGPEVRTYRNADEFLKTFSNDAPGCLILDVRMPGRSGLQLQSDLVARGFDLPVIVMSSYSDVEVAVQAMRQGAVHFLKKPFSKQTMIDEVNVHIARHCAEWEARQGRGDFIASLESLTSREREVADLLVEGKSSKAIARELAISNRTVDAHRARILAKFDARSALELVRMFRDGGMLR